MTLVVQKVVLLQHGDRCTVLHDLAGLVQKEVARLLVGEFLVMLGLIPCIGPLGGRCLQCGRERWIAQDGPNSGRQLPGLFGCKETAMMQCLLTQVREQLDAAPDLCRLQGVAHGQAQAETGEFDGVLLKIDPMDESQQALQHMLVRAPPLMTQAPVQH